MDRKAIVLSIFIILVMIFHTGDVCSICEETESEVTINDRCHMIIGQSYTPHDSISIDDNADFASQGWPGSGINGDPYIIEGLSIEERGAACISITGTTVYFKIKDCLLQKPPTYAGKKDSGVFLENVANGIVLNCIAEEMSLGIQVRDSRNCNLRNNIANDNHGGIYLINSSNCIMQGNTAKGSYYSAISLTDSYNCTLALNTAESNTQGGFKVDNSTYCTLRQNTAHDNSATGFYLAYSTNCTLSLNSAYNNGDSGFICSQSFNWTISNNTAFYNGHNGIRVPSSTNCTLIYNNVYSNSYYGLCLGYASEFNRVYLNRINTNGEGTAEDTGDSNYWDDGVSCGNYWRDYDGHGTYSVPGTAHGVDHYPFVWDPVTTTSNPGDDADLSGPILVVTGAGITAAVIGAVIVLKKRNVSS